MYIIIHNFIKHFMNTDVIINMLYVIMLIKLTRNKLTIALQNQNL